MFTNYLLDKLLRMWYNNNINSRLNKDFKQRKGFKL